MKAENFGIAWLDVDVPFACDIHFSFVKPLRPDRFKVLLIASEPAPIRLSDAELDQVWPQYDLIISHDKAHLKYPNVRYFVFWDTCVNTLPPAKAWEISTIISLGGGPSNMDGYQARVGLYARRLEITMPSRFYISRRLPNWEQTGLPPLPDDKKDAMFTAMFHIAIENTIEPDYFSEKLLDCLNTFTVPLYRGCANLSEHGLDERALIRFHTVDECIAICNQLTPEDYYSRLEYLARGRRARAREGLWLERLRTVILQAWADKKT